MGSFFKALGDFFGGIAGGMGSELFMLLVGIAVFVAYGSCIVYYLCSYGMQVVRKLKYINRMVSNISMIDSYNIDNVSECVKTLRGPIADGFVDFNRDCSGKPSQFIKHTSVVQKPMQRSLAEIIIDYSALLLGVILVAIGIVAVGGGMPMATLAGFISYYAIVFAVMKMSLVLTKHIISNLLDKRFEKFISMLDAKMQPIDAIQHRRMLYNPNAVDSYSRINGGYVDVESSEIEESKVEVSKSEMVKNNIFENDYVEGVKTTATRIVSKSVKNENDNEFMAKAFNHLRNGRISRDEYEEIKLKVKNGLKDFSLFTSISGEDRIIDNIDEVAVNKQLSDIEKVEAEDKEMEVLSSEKMLEVEVDEYAIMQNICENVASEQQDEPIIQNVLTCQSEENLQDVQKQSEQEQVSAFQEFVADEIEPDFDSLDENKETFEQINDEIVATQFEKDIEYVENIDESDCVQQDASFSDEVVATQIEIVEECFETDCDEAVSSNANEQSVLDDEDLINNVDLKTETSKKDRKKVEITKNVSEIEVIEEDISSVVSKKVDFGIKEQVESDVSDERMRELDEILAKGISGELTNEELIRKANEVRLAHDESDESYKTMQQMALLLQKEKERKGDCQDNEKGERNFNKALADLLRAISKKKVN